MSNDQDDFMSRDGLIGLNSDATRDSKPDPNELLILKDIQKKTKLSSGNPEDAGFDDSVKSERFDVMPTTGDITHNGTFYGTKNSLKNPSAAAHQADTRERNSVTSENYTKVYEKRQREQDAQRQGQRRAQATQASKASRAQQQEETAQRNKAQEIREQIQWWRGQFEQGTHDNTTINGMISALESQLNAIPSRFWN